MVLEKIDDTIAAIATPPGNGAVGIIRLSGPRALDLLDQVWEGATRPRTFEARRIYYGKIPHLDSALAFWMKAPSSYTGEDVVEIQGHGGRRVLELILERLLAAGARLAEPGEFSKRAFLNGRMDLTQAEAVADLIKASHSRAVQLAERQMEGDLSRYVGQLRNEMKVMRAQMEAMIDFPEDEDVQGLHENEIVERVDRIGVRIDNLIQTYQEGRYLKDGIRVAILGKPNVGKSSLFNALLGEERAIVHAEPGTTRDTLEEVLELDGLAVRFIDTAGIRLGEGAIEAEGIRRAQEKLKLADLALVVFDLSRPLDEDDRKVLVLVDQALEEGQVKVLRLYNKADLPPAFDPPPAGIVISAIQKDGVHKIKRVLLENLMAHIPTGDGGPLLTNVRHRTALQKGLEALLEVRKACIERKGLECLVADLSVSMDHLGEVTGEVSNDEILGEIFSKFCIGK